MTQAASGEGIRGIFSQKKLAKIGAGTTARKTEIVTYFRVQELEDGAVEVQMLNADGTPFGQPQRTTRDDLLTNYTHETEKSLTMSVPPPNPGSRIVASRPIESYVELMVRPVVTICPNES